MHALANFSFVWLGGFSVLCNLAGKQSISKKLSNKEKKKTQRLSARAKNNYHSPSPITNTYKNTKNIIRYISKEIKGHFCFIFMNYIHIQYTDTICLEVSLTQVSVNNVTDLWLPRGAREYYYAIMS